MWVVLDSVQYCDREWQNRSRITAFHGSSETFWLSVPVHRPHGQQTLIEDITVVDPIGTPSQVRRVLHHSFRGAPHWSCVERFLDKTSESLGDTSLSQLCVNTTATLLAEMNLKPNIIYSSTLPVTGKASTLLAAICRCVSADEYLADSGARAYLREADFGDVGVLWQEWAEPIPKWPGIDSWRDVSGLNYLCREGAAQFGRHMREGQFLPLRCCPETKQ